MRGRRREWWLALAAFPVGLALGSDLDTARAALQDRLFPVAQRHAERALLDPAADRPQALQVVVEAQAEQGLYAELLLTLDAYAAVVRGAPDPEVFAAWRALALWRAGRLDEAARAAAVATGRVSVAADTLRRVGARARLSLGDLAGALALFEATDRATTNAATRASNALEWAAALDGAGRTDAALEVLKAQAEAGADLPSVHDGALLRGRILMRLGKAAEATMVFDQLAMNERAGEVARVQALVEMSVYTFNGGKTNEAVAYARTAFERARQPETRRLAGFRLGDLLTADPATIDEGEALIRSLVREFPEAPASMQAQLKLADALLQARRAERAAAEYRIFLETYPASSLDARVLQGRGWALLQLGRYTEAAGVFQRAAELATNRAERAECRFKQADALLAGGRYAEAAQGYGALADEDPDGALAARAHFQRADCLERAGSLDEAVRQYRATAARYPGREVAPQALLRVASLQAGAGDLDGAVKTYSELLAAFQQRDVRGEALMGRGRAQYRAFRFEAAMQDFAAVAENDPGRRDEARFLLPLCLYGLGRDTEARAAAAAFLLEFPESARLPDMVLWLGKFDFNQGRFADARRFFLDLVARWPGNAWADAALVWAARAAAGESDFTGAVELVSRLVREYPQTPRLSEARLVQADALIELARFDQAVLLLNQVIADAADTEWGAQARLRKGDCLFALGADNGARYQEALEVYRELLRQPALTPSLTLQLHYKAGRCLEKMKQADAAVDQYYAEVLVRFLNERARGVWYDDTSVSLFVRAAFHIAELYEQQGLPEQAAAVLQRVVQAGVPGEEEARQRIERLRRKRS